MELKRLEYQLAVCKVADSSDIRTESDFYFIGRTVGIFAVSTFKRINIRQTCET